MTEIAQRIKDIENTKVVKVKEDTDEGAVNIEIDEIQVSENQTTEK